MARFPTNTLIITEVPDGLLQDPKPLATFLAQHDQTCELISLNKFGRILLICDHSAQAEEIKDILASSEEFSKYRITFSIQDNETAQTYEVETQIDYLELPTEDGSRRFLISPPLSPPPEWDHWDRVEEGPNKQSVFEPEALSHLLWERLGGIGSSEVQKYNSKNEKKRDLKIEPQVLFEDVDNGVPVIMLDRVDLEEPATSKPLVKTALPPMDHSGF